MDQSTVVQIGDRLTLLHPAFSGWSRELPTAWGTPSEAMLCGGFKVYDRSYESILSRMRGVGFESLKLHVKFGECWWDPTGFAKECNSELYKATKGTVGLVGGGQPLSSGYFVVGCRDGKSGFTDMKLSMLNDLIDCAVPQLADWYARRGWEGFNESYKPFDMINQFVRNIWGGRLESLVE